MAAVLAYDLVEYDLVSCESLGRRPSLSLSRNERSWTRVEKDMLIEPEGSIVEGVEINACPDRYRGECDCSVICLSLAFSRDSSYELRQWVVNLEICCRILESTILKPDVGTAEMITGLATVQ